VKGKGFSEGYLELDLYGLISWVKKSEEEKLSIKNAFSQLCSIVSREET